MTSRCPRWSSPSTLGADPKAAVVDHLVAPLDPDHARAVAQLSHDLAAELGIDPDRAAPRRPHITVASYTGLEPVRAAAALAPVLAAVAPFTVRAHGYGVFAGDSDNDLSLHVMVVRTEALDDLHRRLHGALCAAGACVAGTTRPAAWTRTSRSSTGASHRGCWATRSRSSRAGPIARGPSR
jgi:2'-5' RNA ligase superfamily